MADGPPVLRQKGWKKVGDRPWEPDPQQGQQANETPPEPIDLADLDRSLDASHRRMRDALAVQSRRIELAAEKGHLTAMEIQQLGELSNTWRVLVTHEPPPDFGDMTEEEIKAALAAVRARGK
jgi:hypothetical protein